MSGFLDYLNDYEKKFENKEDKKSQLTETIIKDKTIKNQTQKQDQNSKNLHLKKIKKPSTNESDEVIERAINILDETNNCFSDPIVPIDENLIVKEQMLSLTPLTNIQPIDDSMFKFVPIEMLTDQEKQKVIFLRNNQNQNNQNNQNNEREISPISPEVKQMMEETKQLQQMFSTINTNIQIPEIPSEYNYY